MTTYLRLLGVNTVLNALWDIFSHKNHHMSSKEFIAICIL